MAGLLGGKHRESGHSDVEGAGNRTSGEAFRIRCRFAILWRKFDILHVRRRSRPRWRLLMARWGCHTPSSLPSTLAVSGIFVGPFTSGYRASALPPPTTKH